MNVFTLESRTLNNISSSSSEDEGDSQVLDGPKKKKKKKKKIGTSSFKPSMNVIPSKNELDEEIEERELEK